MCAAAIPTNHDRRQMDNFQGENKNKKTHNPQIGKSMNKEETLFSHKT